jgi:hypothetical protein
MQKLNEILDSVSARTGLDVRKNTRQIEYVMARNIYYKIAKDDLRLGTLSAVGKPLSKDHTTVLHGLNNFHQIENYYPKMYSDYLFIKDLFDENKDKESSYEKFVNLDNSFNQLKKEHKQLQDKYYKLLMDSDSNYIVNKMNELSVENQEVLIMRVKAILNMMK